MNLSFAKISTIVMLTVCCASPAAAATIVVAQQHPAASDTNPGSEARPLKSIQAGADRAEPGDMVLVHAGTYREWVKPPRGGISEQKRIVYRAAPGEQVFIKGSDRVSRWRKQENGLYLAEIENGRFEDYNPYKLTIGGEWLDYGDWNHRGDVYCNDSALSERASLDTVVKSVNTWYTTVDSLKTRIWANFGSLNPDSSLVEINVRHTLFFPEKRGLKFITVDGFTIMHSAENWGPPGTRNGEGQWGAIGPRWGYGWIIENCTVINAKCIGISLGVVPGANMDDMATWGHHIVRNNHIMRCGQAGIAGDAGNAASLIDHNLIEFTNDRMQFGGDEQAGIKFHFAVDVTISRNVVRTVCDKEGYGGYGIWLDFGCQNTRVTRNLFIDTKKSCMFLEAFHGPILVDNNVFIGNCIMAHAESQVFVHNLFYKSSVTWSTDTRRSPYYKPHSFKQVKSQSPTPRDDRWYNNMFIGGGLNNAPETPDFKIDYNVFLDGAKPSRYDAHSVVDSGEYNFTMYQDSDLVAIDFGVGRAVTAMKCPFITSKMLGSFPVTGMMLEDKFGSPIEVDEGFFGISRKPGPPRPGAFQRLTEGPNSFTLWSRVAGPARPYRVSVYPSEAVLKPGAGQQFLAVVRDQFGKPVIMPKGALWDVNDGGTITPNGLFTAGLNEAGPVRILAKASHAEGAATGSADLWISRESPGLKYACYEGLWKAVPDFASLTPVKSGTISNFDIGVAARSDSFGMRFDGRINVPAAGTYMFYLNADDGARLFIDGALVTDNDGGHAIKEASRAIELTEGMHPIVITYIESAVQEWLSLEWEGPGLRRQKVANRFLFLPAEKKQ